MSNYNLNEALKRRKAEEPQKNSNGDVKLDDLSRVKVLSPGRQVFKRFIRNRLAVFGSVMLILMFLFCRTSPMFLIIMKGRKVYGFHTSTLHPCCQLKLKADLNCVLIKPVKMWQNLVSIPFMSMSDPLAMLCMIRSCFRLPN